MQTPDSGWKNFFYSRWFLASVLAVIGLVGFAYAKSYFQDYQVRQEIERLKSEASRLEAKKIESLEILEYVQSDDFVEKKARSDFNMVKPGEQIAVIAGRSAGAGSGQVDNQVIELEHIPNPIKWWKFFTQN